MPERNEILTAFKTIMDTALNASADANNETHIGDVNPKDVVSGFRGMVWFKNDTATYVDKDEEWVLRVVAAMIRKDDPSNVSLGQSELLRLSAQYQAVHDAITKATDDPVGTPLDGMKLIVVDDDQEPGISCDGFDDNDRAARIGEIWKVTYRRATP